jgi:cell wall-associated NlpC family hydrolase
MVKGNRILAALAVVFAVLVGGRTAAQPDKEKGYQSPYSVKFTIPTEELCADFNKGFRADPHEESSVPYTDWYSPKIRKEFGAWGPPARSYPAPAGLAARSTEWKRERVIAAGLKFQGYGYQHHHIPDWDPPADWPWKETKGGHNGKGVDCSNFTALAYNFGLGLKFTGDVHHQAELAEIETKPVAIRPKRIEKPKSYTELVQTLKTGDLLFIHPRDKETLVSHVVLWVGAIGQAPDQTPLILDSHGDGVKDSNGVSIPNGIQLRPFLENSWYFQSASHALRIVSTD